MSAASSRRPRGESTRRITDGASAEVIGRASRRDCCGLDSSRASSLPARCSLALTLAASRSAGTPIAGEAGPMLIPRGRGAAVLFGTAGVGGAVFVTGGDGTVFATGGGGGAVFVSGAGGGAAFVTGGDGAVFATDGGGGAVSVNGAGGGAVFVTGGGGGGASAITGAGKATNSVGCAGQSVRADRGCIGAGWLSAVCVASVPELP